MADITSAYENLNRTLRHISDQQLLKQQARRDNELKMMELQNKINDPERRLKRQQAQKLLEPTKLVLPQYGDGGMASREMFESRIQPKLQKYFDKQGWENKDGSLVYKGTNTEVSQPLWQAQQLQADIDAVYATGALGWNKFTEQKASLVRQKKKILGQNKGQERAFVANQISNVDDRIKKIDDEMQNPENAASILRSDILKLEQAVYNNAQRMGGGSKELHTMLTDMLQHNRKKLAAVKSVGDISAVKKIPYHYIDENGKYQVFNIPNDGKYRPIIKHKGLTLKIGDPDGNIPGAGGESKYKIHSVNRRYTMLQLQRSLLSMKLDHEDALKMFRAKNVDATEEETTAFDKLLKSDAEEAIKHVDNELYSYEKIHKDNPNFVVNINKERNDKKSLKLLYGENRDDLNIAKYRKNKKH